MDFGDEGTPVIDNTVVCIQQSEIKRTVAIARPRHIDERTAGQVQCLPKRQYIFGPSDGDKN